MTELKDFYNAGFGWTCRHCEKELKDRTSREEPSRLLHEGEAESKQPRYSNSALARWADPAQTILFCPRCGITEPAEKS